MIKTVRCELSTFKNCDRDLMMRLYMDAQVRRFLGGVIDEKTIGYKFLAMLKPNPEEHYWVIRAKDSSSLKEIGIVSLTQHHNNIDTEVSYQLLPEWWSKGYGTEAVGAIVTYALTVMNLPRVVAETQMANIASCRLLESVGMGLERTVERFGAKQGIYATQL